MAKDRYFYFNKVSDYNDLKGTITVIGLEGTGSVLAEIFARAGFNLRLIDKGRVYLEELQSQSLFLEEDVTKFKAKQAKKRIEGIDANVKVKAFHEELTDETIYLLDSDLIIDCTNTGSISGLVSDYALKQEIPCIFCNVVGTKVEVLVQLEDSVKELILPVDVEVEGVLGSSTYFAAGLISNLSYKVLKGESVNQKYSFDLLSM